VNLTLANLKMPMWRRATSVLLLLLTTRALLAQDVTLAVVLERLHQYLGRYAELLPATIAVERYRQNFRNCCDVDVTFQKVPQLEFWVPTTMRDRCFNGSDSQRGEATYDSYRKFTVETGESLGLPR
jgi:hypothetical protein